MVILNLVSNIVSEIISIFKNFTISDALDITIIAFLIYSVIKFIRETRAAQLVKGLVLLVIVWFLSFQLNLKMVNILLNNFFQFTVLAVFVLFQPEVRRALEQLGRAKIGKYWSNLSPSYSNEEMYNKLEKDIKKISRACDRFSKNKIGALIVFERNTKLGEIIDTGTILDANISIQLLANIFYNKAPLHDGAIIIRNNLIHAAGCILPLTRNDSLSVELGTRHRAAVGISEISDAIVVVVSEETGTISIIKNGIITRNFTQEGLQKTLLESLLPDENQQNNKIQIPFIFERIKKREK